MVVCITASKGGFAAYREPDTGKIPRQSLAWHFASYTFWGHKVTLS